MRLFAFLSVWFFIHSVTNAADSCAWKKHYGNNYWQTRHSKGEPIGRMREKLKSSARYQSLLKIKSLNKAEAAEKLALEQGLSERHAQLRGLTVDGRGEQGTFKLELEALDATNGSIEAARIAVKPEAKRTAVERARYQALLNSGGVDRAAYLAELAELRQLNSAADRAELKALLSSRGDRRFAELKRRQAQGQPPSDRCEAEELAFIEDSVQSHQGTQTVDIPNPETGQNSL